MKNRIYNLGTGFKILGMGLDDIALLVFSWFISFQIIGGLLPARTRLLFGLGVTGLLFLIWRGVKDKVPSGFVPHLLTWIGERNAYDVTPDINPQPVWIDPDHVNEIRRQEARVKRILNARKRHKRRSRPS